MSVSAYAYHFGKQSLENVFKYRELSNWKFVYTCLFSIKWSVFSYKIRLKRHFLNQSKRSTGKTNQWMQ